MLIFLFALSPQEEADIAAFFSEYRGKLFGVAHSYLAVIEDADDAVQQAFLNITGGAEKFSSIPCHERFPFCVVIVRNVCKTMLRQQKSHLSPLLLDDLPESVGPSAADGSESIENAIVAAELLHRLSPAEQQLIRLRYGEDFTYRQIAELMGVREAAARKAEERAIVKLRRWSGEEGQG